MDDEAETLHAIALDQQCRAYPDGQYSAATPRDAFVVTAWRRPDRGERDAGLETP